MAMKHYAYLRVSSTQQIDRSGLKRQRALLTEYAERQGIANLEWIEDAGISAFKGRNTESVG